MRLSEAIRLGATLKPQAFNDQTLGRSCALQAAADALNMSTWTDIALRYAFITKTVDCPHCTDRDWLIRAIWHLNDTHHWTRERIADFVELHEINRLIDTEDACQSEPSREPTRELK